MEHFRVRDFSVFLLVVCAGQLINAVNEEYILDGPLRLLSVDIIRLGHDRERRDAPASPVPDTAVDQQIVPDPVPTTGNVSLSATSEYHTLKMESNDTAAAVTTVSVTQIPLLGVNGSGQLHINLTEKVPKVSEPIMPDDNLTDLLKVNLSNITYDHHNFYNSTFIGDLEYFNEYWRNITVPTAQVHPILSNSHRRATSIRLSFDFPFYGHNIRNITVATGGFIYTGDHVHNWLAATQYIAPLMANFDTTLTNDSLIKLVDDGDNFTAFWENVTLQEDVTKKFTFAVTLFKTGDIVFAYKNIPIDVQDINYAAHPVKVGISDAYLTDKIVFYVRRKTIYEYHRVSFKDHMITNNTILKLVALPTCLQYDTCDDCINHDTGFNCSWCPSINKCSSGTDRNKQDWLLRRCEKTAIANISYCPAHDTVNMNTSATYFNRTGGNRLESPMNATLNNDSRSNIGGIVGALLIFTLVCCLAWGIYAFKYPHTRSGQFLIKYRPSQWNWRRGEARYTAATIHM